MDHVQTERLREQIRREERTLEAWTRKYLDESSRAQFTQDELVREGQYPPHDVWRGGTVLQPLDPTPAELAEEARLAHEMVEAGGHKVDRHVLTRAPLDLAKPVPPGYTCVPRRARVRACGVTRAASRSLDPPSSHFAAPSPRYSRSSRLTHDTRTNALLSDLSPALATPGSVYVKQRFTTSTNDAFKYQRDRIDRDTFLARDKFALRRTWAQAHAEKCMQLGEKPFLSGSSKPTK
jgi:hypothetical protein